MRPRGRALALVAAGLLAAGLATTGCGGSSGEADSVTTTPSTTVPLTTATTSAPATTATSAATVATTTTAAAPLPTATFGGYTGVRPTTIFFSGDSSNDLTGITWSVWDQTEAVGSGMVDVEGCVPNCAQGSQTPTPTTVRLGGVTGGRFTTLSEVISGEPPMDESLPSPYENAS